MGDQSGPVLLRVLNFFNRATSRLLHLENLLQLNILKFKLWNSRLISLSFLFLCWKLTLLKLFFVFISLYLYFMTCMVQFDKSFVRRKKSQLCCTLIPLFALYKKGICTRDLRWARLWNYHVSVLRIYWFLNVAFRKKELSLLILKSFCLMLAKILKTCVDTFELHVITS